MADTLKSWNRGSFSLSTQFFQTISKLSNISHSYSPSAPVGVITVSLGSLYCENFPWPYGVLQIHTGLYPEAHGIVANLFYDPSLNDTFQAMKKESSSNPKWWKGEPIWATAKKNKMRTGSILWPGSETSYHPPDHVVNYNGTMRPIEKMKIITDWLDLPSDKRPGTIPVPFFNIEVYRFLSDLLNINSALTMVR